MRGIYHQFLWSESCPISPNHEKVNCAARRESETAPSLVTPTDRFDPCANAVTPEGFGCYCADQNAVALPGGPTPPKGPTRSTSGARKGDATAGRERTWQSP